ncbi:MAG: glutathione S-transferase N-terminal domain-containing protein [Candidatus Aenigmarchaeota archaeon]|nr:glutathione S-transferase N-terminal domain-containing protein [Candidatus Aenigmarchaeota archaeon]
MEVIIYSAPWCVWCNKTKEFLKQNKIEYRDINIEEDRKAAEEMIRKSGQMSIPVIEVDGKMIIGFDKEALKRALNLKD